MSDDTPIIDAGLADDAALPMSRRFRGFLPVVVDVETGGFNPSTDALLEIAAVLVEIQGDGPGPWRDVSLPRRAFEGANRAGVTGSERHHPGPSAASGDTGEGCAAAHLQEVRQAVRGNDCTRAILVGTMHSSISGSSTPPRRTGIKRNPFHPFTSFDTATLGGAVFGQTVLSRIAAAAGMEWDSSSAHSAAYDAEITADLFCKMINLVKPVYEGDPGR